ncbi:glud2 [Symbiodinium necroappetens]|uniref:Glud2 protein n=1 Tax=Symbiodinium necroappetens TaxID=1628268 RepID=A0A813BE94_9DINO|nr:glud2 [Symbiodinium necroappetens]
MASQGPAFRGEEERLGIYNIERGHFEVSRVAENETSLQILASSTFLKGKTREAIEQYQIIMEDVVASRRSMVNIIPGEAYPGNFSGFVVLFATAETAGRNYIQEVWQAMRFVGLVPRRFYFSTFANGVIAYSLFFPGGVPETQVECLKRALLYSTLLKATPGNSELVYRSVMQSQISHECGLYVLAAVKFVYTFFPKEQYAPEYISVHKVLEHDAASQRKLETLYKLCIKDLLSTERIYSLIHRHPNLARLFFEDFALIARGEREPHFNEELSSVIDEACTDPQDRQILKMFLTFNHSILLTNFFKAQIPGALSFRLDPAVALKDRPASLYPEVPYGIYLVCGRDFMGFHTRFRDVARGGIRLVLSRDKTTYDRNFATLFDECYNLAFTQQYKNKDRPAP